MPSLTSGSGRDALPDVREWSGDPNRCPRLVESPPECQDVVKRTSRMSAIGWEALPDVRKWSSDPPRCLGVVGRPFQKSAIGREALPDV